MGLKFEKLWSAPLGDALDIAQDGKYLYVLSSGNINMYTWWGESSGHEPTWENYGNLEWHLDTDKLKLVYTFPHGMAGAKWMLMGYKCLWVINDTMIKKVDIIETAPVNKLQQPTLGLWAVDIKIDYLTSKKHICNPYYIDEKIWFLLERNNTATPHYEVTDTIQQYCIFDTLTGICDFFELPVPFQESRADFAFGYNNYMYMTCVNDFSVLKFDLYGGVVSKIEVNGNPYKLFVDPYTRKIYCVSHSQMVSIIDPVTDLVTHVQGSAIGSILSLSFIDQDNYWYCDGAALAKNNLPTKHHIFSGGEEDYNFTLADAAVNKVLVSKQFTYQTWNNGFNTVTVSPYLFFLGATGLYAVRLVNELCTENKLDVDGHTMLIVGPHNYQGVYS